MVLIINILQKYPFVNPIAIDYIVNTIEGGACLPHHISFFQEVQNA